MNAHQMIVALDRGLAQGSSETITLRLVVGDAPNETNLDVDCIARVNAVDDQQIAAGIRATDLNIIMSPTQITAAGWPGASAPATTRDPRIPEPNGPYKVIMRGEPERTIVFVDPKFADGELVRLNMRVSG